MIEPRSPRAWRDMGAFALAWFGACFLLTAAVGVFWVADLRSPQVTLLGSDDGALGVFVSAGQSRLLIAHGADPASLMTALERARHPLARRLDVVLIGASGNDLRGALPLFVDPGGTRFFLLGPRPDSPFSEALPAGVVNLDGPVEIHLAPGLSVITAPVPGKDPAASPDWYVLITQNNRSVLVVSSPAVADGLALPAAPEALVVAGGGDPLPAWSAVPSPLLVFADGAISGIELRAAVRDNGGPAWAIRVHPGEAVRLDFDAGEVSFSTSAAQQLATPASGGQPRAGRRRTQRRLRLAGRRRATGQPR